MDLRIDFTGRFLIKSSSGGTRTSNPSKSGSRPRGVHFHIINRLKVFRGERI